MMGNCHVRCGAGENSEIISKNYLSLLGTIPRFEELLATMRSMEISANVIIQNLSQLKKMYKDSWENVLGNCDSLLFLGGQEPTTLEHVSKTLGKETIDTRSRNRTKGKNGSTSENDGILGRELMTVDELKVMKDNECILFVRGLYPFFCDKFVIEKHPNYKLLEDSDKKNAYLLSNIKSVKFQYEKENENLNTEPADESEKSEDVLANETEQSVTIEEIIGTQEHTYSVLKEFPTDPKKGTASAQIDNTEVIVTAEPKIDAGPPFPDVVEDNYLNEYDLIY